MTEATKRRDFKRVVLKLSGEALREDGSQDNISPEIVEDMATQIKGAHQSGLEVAVGSSRWDRPWRRGGSWDGRERADSHSARVEGICWGWRMAERGHSCMARRSRRRRRVPGTLDVLLGKPTLCDRETGMSPLRQAAEAHENVL